MIKIYFDWNVLSQIKNGQHAELKEIVFNNDRFLIPFSTSHIGDIFASYTGEEKQSENINSDLQFISELTHNQCLFNTGKNIVLDTYSPEELLQQRIDDKDILENPLEFFNATCAELGMRNIFDLFNNIPLDKKVIEIIENPEYAKQTNSFVSQT